LSNDSPKWLQPNRVARETEATEAPFGWADKLAEKHCCLIYCERKTLFWLKNKFKKTDYKPGEHGQSCAKQGLNPREVKKGVSCEYYSTSYISIYQNMSSNRDTEMLSVH
jgi:hypothetical protein